MTSRLLSLLQFPKKQIWNATGLRMGYRSFATSQYAASAAKKSGTVKEQDEDKSTVSAVTTKPEAKKKSPFTVTSITAKLPVTRKKRNKDSEKESGTAVKPKGEKKAAKEPGTVKEKEKEKSNASAVETKPEAKKKSRFKTTSITAKLPVRRKRNMDSEKESGTAVKPKREKKKVVVPEPIDPTTLSGFSDEHCVLAIDPGFSNFGIAILTCSGHLLRWENIALFNKHTTFDSACYATTLVNFIHEAFDKAYFTPGGAPKSVSIVIEKQHLSGGSYALAKVRSVESALWGVLMTMIRSDVFRTQWKRNVVADPINPKDVAARFEISKKFIEQKVADGTIQYRPKKPTNEKLGNAASYQLKKRAAVRIVTEIVTGDPKEFRPMTDGGTRMQKVFCSPDQLHSFLTSNKKDDWADVLLMAVRRMELDRPKEVLKIEMPLRGSTSPC